MERRRSVKPQRLSKVSIHQYSLLALIRPLAKNIDSSEVRKCPQIKRSPETEALIEITMCKIVIFVNY